jgi:Flp pilus assembly protein TadG
MLCHNQKGAALIEFAIILPLILLLVFGAIEFGFLFYNKQVLTNASREAARAAIVKPDPKNPIDIPKIVTDYCNQNLIDLGGDTKLPEKINISTAGDYVTVHLEYTYDFLFMPFFGFSKDITIAGQTVMRME